MSPKEMKKNWLSIGIISAVLLISSIPLPAMRLQVEKQKYLETKGKECLITSQDWDIIVDDDGDTGYKSIQDAINDAKPGDRIYVKSGVYKKILINKDNLVIHGEDRNTTIINGSGNGKSINLAPYAKRVRQLNKHITNRSKSLVKNRYKDILTTNHKREIESIEENPHILLYNKKKSCILTNDDEIEHIVTIFGNNINFTGFTIENSKEWGAGIYCKSDNNLIKEILITDTYSGIFSYKSDNNIIKNNLFKNILFPGIELRYSSDNTIQNNFFQENYDAVALIQSPNNIIKNNNVKDCFGGIVLSISKNCTVSNNTFNHSGVVIYASSPIFWTTHTIQDNTANGKPILYFKNTKNNVIPKNTAQVILANCTNFTIKNIDFPGTDTCIQIGFSKNINISKNDISDNNFEGIYLVHSNGNNISDNFFTKNCQHTIDLYYSDENVIQKNTFIKNGIFSLFFVHNSITLFNSCKNTITKNNINKSACDGIHLGNNSNDNDITFNKINDSNWYGVELEKSSDNFIYNNSVANSSVFDGIAIVDSSNNNNISYNLIEKNSETGITIFLSEENNVYKNILKSNGWGIFLHKAVDNIISHNELQYHNSDGLQISHSKNNKIYYNNISNNFVGISLWEICKKNQFIKNNFIENDGRDAFFMSALCPKNEWDRNYWDNWIGLKLEVLSFLPKRIPAGIFGLRPRCNFDWHPATEPYDI